MIITSFRNWAVGATVGQAGSQLGRKFTVFAHRSLQSKPLYNKIIQQEQLNLEQIVFGFVSHFIQCVANTINKINNIKWHSGCKKHFGESKIGSGTVSSQLHNFNTMYSEKLYILCEWLCQVRLYQVILMHFWFFCLQYYPF